MNSVHHHGGHVSGLNQLLDDMASGVRPVLLLEGAAGLGKSTALAGLVAAARQRGADVRIAAADGDNHLTVREQLDRPASWAPSSGLGRVLIVDDAHRADAESLAWIHAELAAPPEQRVACALTLRRGEVVTAPEEIERLRRALHSRTVSLRPLGPLGIAQLIARSYGVSPSPEFARACYRSTRGVPLLAVELLGALHSHGVAPDATGQAAVADASSDVVADAATRLLGRRHPLAVTAAQALAVLDRPVTAAAVAQLCEVNQGAATDMLAALAAAEMTNPRTGQFFHPFLRQSLYRSLSRAEREGWHDAAARLLRHDADAEIVAGHVQLGRRGIDPRTAAVSMAVAERCLAEGRRDLAAGCLDMAIDQVASPTKRTTLQLSLARTLRHARDCRTHEALNHVSTEGSPAERLVAASLALHLHARDVGLIPDSPLAIDHAIGRDVKAVRALIAAPGADPTLSLVQVRSGGDRQRAVTAAREELALPVTPDGPTAPTTAALLALIDAEHLDEADAVLASWAEVAPHDVEVDTLQARCLLRRGHVAAAADKASSVHRHIQGGAGPPLGHTWFLVLMEALRETGTAPPTDAMAPGGSAADPVSQLEHRLAVSLAIHLDTRDAQREREAIGAASEELGLHHPTSLPWRTYALAEWSPTTAAADGARLATLNLAAAQQLDADSAVGAALLLLAKFVPPAERDELLEQARERAMSGPDELLRARVRLAMGLRQRADGDRTTARALLAEALDEAGRLGAKRTADLAYHALQEAGGRPRRRRNTGVAGLTDREREIAQLAAEGQTNREIAEELFLTQRTIELHLTKAFRKLGIARRSELTDHLNPVSDPGEGPRRPE